MAHAYPNHVNPQTILHYLRIIEIFYGENIQELSIYNTIAANILLAETPHAIHFVWNIGLDIAGKSWHILRWYHYMQSVPYTYS